MSFFEVVVDAEKRFFILFFQQKKLQRHRLEMNEQNGGRNDQKLLNSFSVER
jgi:hypothetical protein